MTQRLLIIGAGMATAYLLQALKDLPHNFAITVIGDEDEVCYNRVLLSNVLSGENRASDTDMLTDTGAVEVVTGTRIITIDAESRTARADSGRSFSYEKLVIATGAQVALPSIDATNINGVRVFRTLGDARELQQLAVTSAHAVVVGGGLLGLEAAHGLNHLGFSTTVLHRQPHLMNRQLDREGGDQLHKDLQARGIAFHLNTSVSALHSDAGAVTGISLKDGSTLPCDLLLFATGITPNTTLAANAGIYSQRGIVVNSRLRTSDPNTFALGECSQFGEHCFGLVAPIRDQAQVLARELTGMGGRDFTVERWPTQLKISGIDIYSAGELDTDAEQLVLRDKVRGTYRRLIIRDDRLIGAVLVGDKRGGTWYAELIRSQKNISTFRSALMFGKEAAEALRLTAAAA
ncbi:MAG: nitrite reductase (NADH) large subunit [Halieaceae bacterium]|jgi:nitrite reductase (NADH) large subunit